MPSVDDVQKGRTKEESRAAKQVGAERDPWNDPDRSRGMGASDGFGDSARSRHPLRPNPSACERGTGRSPHCGQAHGGILGNQIGQTRSLIAHHEAVLAELKQQLQQLESLAAEADSVDEEE